MDEKLKGVIVSCIEKCLQTENFSKMKVDFGGTSEKGDGFIADMIFVVVTETDKNSKYKEIHLAVKIGKRSEKFRENIPSVVDCYEREIFLYDTVLPTFRKFQLERNIVNVFDGVPKCYGTVVSDDIEALLLENLRKKGFMLHDKQKPLNVPHLHLVLKNYAKFHALSFAFRDQHKDEYNKLTADYYSVFEKILPHWMIAESDPRVQRVLREAGRDDLAAKYVEESNNDELAKLLSILKDVPQESVILHGDCHNNNLLFQYEGDDKENPLRVAIIDWQESGIHSPVLDLSYLLYCTAPGKELYEMDTKDGILRFYHSQLTDFMKQLGSDSQKIFPYSTLVEHWKKYSSWGLFLARNTLQMFYIPAADTPEITGDMEKDQHVWKYMKLENEQVYRERIISAVDQFVQFTK